jgi:hypothetical protein
MQVSSATSPTATTSTGSSLVDQIKRQAAILADDSGATNDQKVDAYIAITKAMAQSANAGSGWFQQSTQADRDAVNAVMDSSSMAKQIRQSADDFNARGMRGSRDGNVMADQLNYLNGLSETQQKMIFAGTASLDQTGSLDSWKGFLQQNADARDQQLAAEAPGSSAVKVTLSDDAKAAMVQSKDGVKAETADPSADALAALAKGGEDDGVAGAALKMLQKAAEQRAEAREKAQIEENTKAPAEQSKTSYEAGQTVDARI